MFRIPRLNPFALRHRKYTENFTYELGRDFPTQLGRTSTSIDVHDGHLALPPAPKGSARFVALDVASTRTGAFVDPVIESKANAAPRAQTGGPASWKQDALTAEPPTVRQYLERTCAGRRFLNVSDLYQGSIHLTGRGVDIPNQSADVYTFEPSEVETPILVLAPHPDDAEIAAFGLYADRDAWVATASAGEVGTHDFGGLFSGDEAGARFRAETRILESISAPMHGGVPVSRAVNLAYPDGALDRMWHGQRGTSAAVAAYPLTTYRRRNAIELPTVEEPQWRTVLQDLRWLLDKAQPRTIVCPHPQFDLHPDHRALGLAALEACAAQNSTTGRLFFYVVHPPGAGLVNVHPVGPRDGVVSIPPTDNASIDEVIHHEPLDEARVRRKIVALDVFRDIREAPVKTDTLSRAAYEAARAVYRHLAVYDTSFLRKAARPNELFFTAGLREAQDLLHKYQTLAKCPSRSSTRR